MLDALVGEVGFLSCRGWDVPAEEYGRGAVAGTIAPPGQVVARVVKWKRLGMPLRKRSVGSCRGCDRPFGSS